MRLYHGSQKIIKYPVYGQGHIYNDYGIGFYTTEYKQLAGEWAVFSTKKDGHINEYDFDLNGLNVLDLDRMHIGYWVSVLLANRNVYMQDEMRGNMEDDSKLIQSVYSIDINSCDVIKGWRADDSFFSYIKDFLANALSLEKLKEAMKFGELGTQYCIKSEKAFAQIHYAAGETAPAVMYFDTAFDRDKRAREGYKKLQDKRNGTLLVDIIRGGVR